MQTNNKYIIKIIAPWMIDELIVFSKHAKVDIILLQEQEEFYHAGIQRLNIKNLTTYTAPFSNKKLVRKLWISFKFLVRNIFSFRPPSYNSVIGLKGIYWFIKLDMSLFSSTSNMHAQFATQSSIIAMLIKEFYRNKPSYSFTYHAYDIYFKNRWFDKIVAKCDKAFSISEYNIRYIEENYNPSSKLTLSRLGVFANKMNINKRPKDNFLTLGLMSWFMEKKGIAYLLKSFVELKTMGRDNIRLLLAGDGPLKEEILSFIKANNLDSQVSYIGSVDGDSKEAFYNKLDAFVLPCIALENDQDGIPVVLMESIAYGIPIISTKVSGVPEICLNKYNGLLIEERNVTQLTEAIIFLAENPIEMNKFQKNSLELSKSYDIELNAKDKMKSMNWIA